MVDGGVEDAGAEVDQVAVDVGGRDEGLDGVAPGRGGGDEGGECEGEWPDDRDCSEVWAVHG